MLAVIAMLAAAGCWETTGANPGRTYNPVEVKINAGNVSTLVQDWVATRPAGR